MHPIIKFEKDRRRRHRPEASDYQAMHCYAYEYSRLNSLTQALIQIISEHPDALQVGGSDNYERSLNFMLKSQIISPMGFKQTSYKALTKDLRKSISDLLEKFKTALVANQEVTLNAEERNLFEDSLLLFINPEYTKSLNHNYKAKSTKELFTVLEAKIKLTEDTEAIHLPQDFPLILKALEFIFSNQSSLTTIKDAIVTEMIREINYDLDSDELNGKEGEVCLVRQAEWSSDEEVKSGIVLRDKAHEQRNGFAIVLTTEELELMTQEQMNALHLRSIYKLSTLMHSSSEFSEQFCLRIDQLARACCSSSEGPYCLRELVIRQCFGAGDRPAVDENELSVARVDGAEPPSEDDATAINNLVTHFSRTPLNELPELHARMQTGAYQSEMKNKLYELKTRESHALEGNSYLPVGARRASNPLVMLANTLREDGELRVKVPDLLIKGYYGPLAPYPLGSDAAMLLPAEQRGASQNPPNRFYKATRVAVFKEPDAEELPQHQPRK